MVRERLLLALASCDLEDIAIGLLAKTDVVTYALELVMGRDELCPRLGHQHDGRGGGCKCVLPDRCSKAPLKTSKGQCGIEFGDTGRRKVNSFLRSMQPLRDRMGDNLTLSGHEVSSRIPQECMVHEVDCQMVALRVGKTVHDRKKRYGRAGKQERQGAQCRCGNDGF